MGGCSGGAGAESTEGRRTWVVKNHSCWRPGQLRPLQGFLKSPCMHSTSAISRCLLCRPRTDNPMSVPSSVLPPGPNTQKETAKMNPKDEGREGRGEISKAHQTPQGGTICTTGHTCTKGGEECETGCEIRTYSGLYCPRCSKTWKSEMLQELPKMLWKDRKQVSIKAHLEKENEAVSC